MHQTANNLERGKIRFIVGKSQLPEEIEEPQGLHGFKTGMLWANGFAIGCRDGIYIYCPEILFIFKDIALFFLATLFSQDLFCIVSGKCFNPGRYRHR